MITDNEYRKMRDKLADAARETCLICTEPKIPRANLNVDHSDKCTCQCEKVAAILTAMRGMACKYEDKAIEAVLRGEFKEALEWWRGSDACSSSCDDCPQDGMQCAGIFETYLTSSLHRGIDKDHIEQFMEWARATERS